MKRTILIGFTLAMATLVALAGQIKKNDVAESGSSAATAGLGKIKGKVTNKKTGDPISSAHVQIQGTTMGALTGPDGEYLIINIPPKTYTLVSRQVGYVPLKVEQVAVIADHTTTVDFALEETTVQMEKLQVVTVERDLLRQTDTQAQRQLSAEAAKNAPSTTVQELLQFQIPVEQRGGQIHVRGGRSNETGGGIHPAPTCKPPSYGTPMSNGGSVPPNGQQYDAMFFKHYGVNPFVSTDDDHLSTFAIDADNASYSMTRSYLTRGSLPPEEAVRVEEFVNNFKYEYRHPQERAFRVCLEGAPSKFGDKYQLLKIGIVGKKIEECRRQDANLVFVIDVSGSMNMENRLGAVKKALHMLVDNLTDRDRVGIVAYRTDAFEVLSPTSIRDRERIIRAIDDLYASGSTWAEGGLRLGYQMANRCFDRNKINRIILCTDGVANEGQTAAEDILKEIKQYADRGITLSAIGFGMNNYNDVLLEKLGDKGNGHYAYVDNWEEARRIFVENLTGTLQVIARDVKIQVDFNPNTVDRYRLLGYENRDVADNQFRNDKVDGGEIGSGHTVTALYEIKLKDEAHGDLGTVYVRYKDPNTFAVSEVAEPIDQSYFCHSFESASCDFRLAAAAAEFAEILRKSYWAQDGHLSDVLRVVGQVERERCDDQVIELMDLVAKADRMMKANEDGQGPLGMETE